MEGVLVNGTWYTAQNIVERWQKEEGLLHSPLRSVLNFLRLWFAPSPTIEVQTSGSTGKPKRIQVAKSQMIESAKLTCRTLQIQRGESTLLCMNPIYIGAQMMIVRAIVAGLELIVVPPSSHPLALVERPISFAAMVPLQVYSSLEHAQERLRLAQIKKLIIGGGAIDATIENELRLFNGEIYATYGMTETLSHIALRRINGENASNWFTPLDGITISLSERQTLIIDAPRITYERLETNDIAEISPDGTFRLLGRSDNVINSGGIKIITEEVERLLSPFIATDYAISAVSDKALGERIVLLTTSPPPYEQLLSLIKEHLPPYYCPKEIIYTKSIPRTPNGKISRKELRELTLKLRS